MNRLTFLAILALIISCVFDPADKILYLKVPLFCACWITMLLDVIINKKHFAIPLWMIMYLLTILLIPMISITYYSSFNGDSPYDGFQYFKSLLFVTIIVVLHVSNINVTKPLCFVLTALSIVIISIPIITYGNRALFDAFYLIGLEYENYVLGYRQYGPMSFYSIFYKTSPMIAFAITYYVFMSITHHGNKKLLYILLSLINITAMFLAGTRNNIFAAILLPSIVFIITAKYSKVMLVAFLSIALCAISFYFRDVIWDMFDTKDVSNAIKLGYLADYKAIFDKPANLLFGQGVGSYHYWTVLGGEASITELTFLELIRNYGLIGGTVLLALILYPLVMFNLKRNRITSCLLIGYVFYLIMSFSNPFLFSSSGMLILAVILSNKSLREIKAPKLLYQS